MEYHVQIIPQETNNTCWAAAMAMLLQYLSGRSRPSTVQPASPFTIRFTPRYVAEQVGGVVLWAYNRNTMLSSDIHSNFDDLARPWNLQTQFDLYNPSAEEWERLLRQNGPYFVQMNTDATTDHAVVVSGINRDHLTIVDPWPVGRGRWFRKALHKIRLTGTAIHSRRGTSVLQPSRGGGP